MRGNDRVGLLLGSVIAIILPQVLHSRFPQAHKLTLHHSPTHSCIIHNQWFDSPAQLASLNRPHAFLMNNIIIIIIRYTGFPLAKLFTPSSHRLRAFSFPACTYHQTFKQRTGPSFKSLSNPLLSLDSRWSQHR